MIISANVFEAYLKCPSKCWFRIHGEDATDNRYTQWLLKENAAYRTEGLKRLHDNVRNSDFSTATSQPIDIKKAAWRLAADVAVRKGNVEASIHAIERLSSESKSFQFIPVAQPDKRVSSSFIYALFTSYSALNFSQHACTIVGDQWIDCFLIEVDDSDCDL